jgi:hypothetical protein
MDNKRTDRDRWDKIQIVAQILSSVAVPVSIAIVGFFLQRANVGIADRQARVQEAKLFVELIDSLESDDELRTRIAEGAIQHLLGSRNFEEQWSRAELRELLTTFIDARLDLSMERLDRAIATAREKPTPGT